MGLFEKKFCDFCGNKIGMLGNKKFEDGNMCKECASKLSPWFNERRHSTKSDLEAQLAYREQNKQAVASFNTTRTFGNHTKLMIDDNARKFMVTNASDTMAANPDVLDFSQVTGCALDMQESRHEIKRKDNEGKSVSYNPPKYEYSYNFFVSIRVNSPYFDEIRYSLSNGSVKTGEHQMNTVAGGWNVTSSHLTGRMGMNKYNEYVALGNEIKSAVDGMRMSGGMGQPMMGQPMMGQPMTGQPMQQPVMQQPVMQQPMMQQPMQQPVQEQAAPAGGKFCIHCGSQVKAGAKFCEFCGGQIG